MFQGICHSLRRVMNGCGRSRNISKIFLKKRMSTEVTGYRKSRWPAKTRQSFPSSMKRSQSLGHVPSQSPSVSSSANRYVRAKLHDVFESGVTVVEDREVLSVFGVTVESESSAKLARLRPDGPCRGRLELRLKPTMCSLVRWARFPDSQRPHVEHHLYSRPSTVLTTGSPAFGACFFHGSVMMYES